MSSHARATAIVFTLFSVGVLGGAVVGSRAAERARDPYAGLDTFVRVMGLIQSAYVEEIPPETLAEAAIEGMVAKLDPHSAWMPPARHQALRSDTQGATTGIGVEVDHGPSGAVITRILPGSPAAREGLSVGDRILEIDGVPVDAEHPDAPGLLLGERGVVARLRVLREGWTTPQLVEATRDLVRVPGVEVGRLDDEVHYARIVQFQQGAAEELRAGLARQQTPTPMKALVLDVRDNPGGLLDEAIAIADLFLDEGPIVSTWGRLVSEQAEHRATPGGYPSDLPVVLLINNGSASASEILAGALQDTGRALVVGVRTWGKGSVQTLFEARDGSALKLTIGRYYTPSGEPVAPRDGRRPDVEVPWPVAATTRDRLHARIEALPVSSDEREAMVSLLLRLPPGDAPESAGIPWSRPLAERVSTDPQLAAARRLIRERAGLKP